MQQILNKLLQQKPDGYRLPWSEQEELAKTTGQSLREVEDAALALGIIPVRYQRNTNSISVEEQHRLLNSQVAVIGCGGLGGYVIEELARLGVGSIKAWDYDVFEEHNLNRQLLAQMNNIGQSKVKTAARRVRSINPVVEFTALNLKFDEQSGPEHLPGCQVVIDALDNIPSRMVLAGVCSNLNIPLVHGAIGGWYGQVTTEFPGDKTLEQLYGHLKNSRGIEVDQGMFSFIPPLIASLQVAEAVKILLAKGDLLRRKVMFINLLDMDIDILEMSEGR